MTTYAALLRAVNVGGTGKVSMAELRAMAEKAGLKNARTLVQSGNLVFETAAKSGAAENLLEGSFEKTFGSRPDIHVRTGIELAQIIARNPFPKEAKNDPARLHVLFMREAPAPSAYEALQAAIVGREEVRGDGRHAYMYYPDGQGVSKLTPAVLTRHLGMQGTARNWNTLTKLAALTAA